MKPQYKIGTLVEYANPAQQTGVIEGQIIRKDGIFYEMKDTDSVVIAETDIVNAFRPITPRKTKAKKHTIPKKATAKKENHLDA